MTDQREQPPKMKERICDCGERLGLRRLHDGYWDVPPEYICEACFTGQDDGPCWDDLPEVKS